MKKKTNIESVSIDELRARIQEAKNDGDVMQEITELKRRETKIVDNAGD